MTVAARCCVALAVFLILLAPSATAASRAITANQLALMPLSLAAYGSQVRGLPLASDSGVASNAIAAADANQTVTGAKLAKDGRLTGYVLDFGGPPTGRRVFEAESAIDVYATHAQAVAGLAFWRKDESAAPLPASRVISIDAHFSPVAGFGRDSFEYAGSGTAKGVAPFYEADIYFVQGDLIADVTVSAADAAPTKPLALAAARALRSRIAGVLAGRIKGLPVRLPVTSTTSAGPPPGGPKLASLALTLSDVGSGTIESQGYQKDPDFNPISEYHREFVPGGRFAFLEETIDYYADAAQASWVLTLTHDLFSIGSEWKQVVGPQFKSFTPTVVHLSAGDEARSVLGVAQLKNGQSFYLSFVGVRKGRTLFVMIAATPVGTKMLPSNVKSLATTATKRSTPQNALTA